MVEYDSDSGYSYIQQKTLLENLNCQDDLTKIAKELLLSHIQELTKEKDNQKYTKYQLIAEISKKIKNKNVNWQNLGGILNPHLNKYINYSALDGEAVDINQIKEDFDKVIQEVQKSTDTKNNNFQDIKDLNEGEIQILFNDFLINKIGLKSFDTNNNYKIYDKNGEEISVVFELPANLESNEYFVVNKTYLDSFKDKFEIFRLPPKENSQSDEDYLEDILQKFLITNP